MITIGVISDTHGFLDPKVAKLFAAVDHILHAGDIGTDSAGRNPTLSSSAIRICPASSGGGT